MNSVAVTDDHADRRRHTRRAVYRTAELVLRGGGEGFGCTVLDESEGGLQVELEQKLMQAHDLPEEALIRFSDTASQLVRRCWAKGARAGYQYIEIAPAEPAVVAGGAAKAFEDAESRPARLAQARLFTFSDIIHISCRLLGLSKQPEELLYPAERIHNALVKAGAEPNPHAMAPDWKALRAFFAPRQPSSPEQTSGIASF